MTESVTPYASRWPMVLVMLVIATAASLFYNREVMTFGASNLTQQLGRAFLEGHTYLDAAPNPELLSLPNPYDAKQNENLRFHDASLYRGKYYLYFGPAPAIILWIPVTLLTGIELKDPAIIYIFSVIGTWSMCLLLYFISQNRRLLHSVGLGMGMISLCLGTFIPLIIHRPNVYQVAATGGYCFTALGALMLWVALIKQRRLWMGLASLAFGLAVGCRISLGLNIILLVAAAFYFRTRAGSGKAWFASLCSLFIPWGLCLMGLAAYNYARFGSLLETGFYYQLSLFNYRDPHFSIFDTKQAMFRAYFYFFQPLPWISVFSQPFFDENWQHVMKAFWRDDPVIPFQEGVFGLFTNTPFSFWAFPTLFGMFRTGGSAALRTFIRSVMAYAIANAVFLVFYFFSTLRYSLDFTPWIVLVAAVGYMHQLQYCKTRKHYFCILALGVLAVAYSTYGEILLGLECLHSTCF